MSCFTSNNSEKFILFLSIFVFVSFTTGNSHTLRTTGVGVVGIGGEREYEYEYDGTMVTWGTRRSVAEGVVQNSSLTLAKEKTHRKDPLNGYKRYTGGWNITSKHYWASVGYTAVPFLVIAVLWLSVVVISLCLIIWLCHFCCPREPCGYSRTAYTLSPILLIFFTIAAIVGFTVLFTGEGKFHAGATNTMNYVVDRADIAVENLRNASYYLSAAKKIGVDDVFLPADAESKIDNLLTKINSSATTLSDTTEKSSQIIKHVLNVMRLLLIPFVAAMLFLALLGFLFSILGMQARVCFLVIVGWILVALAFVLCGGFVVLHNAVADTCVAMDEWVQNPAIHTALDAILPCVNNATAQETLLCTKDVTSQLVTLVNHAITHVNDHHSEIRPVPLLCNPFNSHLIDRKCTSHEISLKNATQVWKKYVCEFSKGGVCRTPGRLTPALYAQIEDAVNVSYHLYRKVPLLVKLQGCTFVRGTFIDITNGTCSGLQQHSRWIYIGLAMVSIALMLLLIVFVIYARERRHRLYIEQCFMDRAIEEFRDHKEPHI